MWTDRPSFARSFIDYVAKSSPGVWSGDFPDNSTKRKVLKAAHLSPTYLPT